MAQLPRNILSISLDQGTLPGWMRAWAWFARALSAYRSGDPESALQYVHESQSGSHYRNDIVEALNLAVSALSQYQLGHVDQSRSDHGQASRLVLQLLSQNYDNDKGEDLFAGTSTNLYSLYSDNGHDLLISFILLREAGGLLYGKTHPASLREVERFLTEFIASTPKPLTHRAKLLAVADQADSIAWRRKLRNALKNREITTLKELAASDETRVQSPNLVAWLGMVLREAGEFELSIAVLTDAQQDHPGDFWLNHELGRSLGASGDAVRAIEFARAALAIRPDSLGALSSLANTLSDAGRTEEFHKVHQQVLSHIGETALPQDSSWMEKVIGDLRDGIEHDPAERERLITRMRGYTEAYPQDAKGHLVLAMVLSYQRDQLDEVLAELRKVKQLDPQSALTYAWFPRTLGDRLRNQGQLQEAIAAYRLALDLNPDDSLMWVNLAPLLIVSGDEAAYVEHCQWMVKQFAGTADVTSASRTCQVCTSLPNAVDLALLPDATLAKALDEWSITNTNILPWRWCARAMVAYRRGDARAALRYLDRAEEYRPTDSAYPQILAVRALTQQQLGDLDAARRDVESTLKLMDSLPGNDMYFNNQLTAHPPARSSSRD